jgi:hypothetical protein
MNLQGLMNGAAGALGGLLGVNDDEEQNREKEAARQEGAKQRGHAAFQRAIGNPYIGASGFHNWVQGAMAPGMEAHANAMGQVNNAISDEMDSRVAQEREMRRMEHEKELAQIKANAMMQQNNSDRDSMIIRSLLAG